MVTQGAANPLMRVQISLRPLGIVVTDEGDEKMRPEVIFICSKCKCDFITHNYAVSLRETNKDTRVVEAIELIASCPDCIDTVLRIIDGKDADRIAKIITLEVEEYFDTMRS